jgi:tetratricopeptide (TPR) repeat protein
VRLVSASTILLALAACAPARRPSGMAPPSASARLAVADAEVRAGCLECLEAAYRDYQSLRLDPSAADSATAGAIRAAALVTMRERELGLPEGDYLQQARAIAASTPNLPAWLTTVLDVTDAMPPGRAASRPATTDVDLARLRATREHRDAWSAVLHNASAYDEAAAYAWVVTQCDADARTTRPSDIFAAVSTFAGAPLIVYREALCRATEVETLRSLLTANPRFVEIAYSLGVAALGSRPRPLLDEAEEWFRQAYAWRPKWPTLTLAMAGVAMTAEDFDRARTLYEETLVIDPHFADALLGDLRAITYLGAAADAIAVADRMLAEGLYVGDARYWRSFNELQLSRLDEAWDDIEKAERALVNAQVPKLAGLIAYRREHLDVAIARFTTSLDRNPFDCETQFYLGLVHADLRQWPQTAEVLTVAAKCFASVELELTEDIAQIRQSNVADDRKARQIARREQQILEGRRRIAASWFDIAVADFSLSKKDEAREYAQKVSDDEQFGERARELLARLR